MSSSPFGFRLLPDGRDVLEALAEAFPVPSGWVLASGYIEEVELRVVAAGRDRREELGGRYVLASLSGPLAGPHGVTLSRIEGGRVEALAGVLIRGRSAGVNACCLTASGEVALALARTGEQAVGPAAPTVPVATGGARWAVQASAAAARAAAAEPVEATEEPEPSDLVEHFAFGVCEVVGVRGERLLIRDKARGGRVLEIHLDMLVVHPPVQRDGKRLFRVSRRG